MWLILHWTVVNPSWEYIRNKDFGSGAVPKNLCLDCIPRCPCRRSGHSNGCVFFNCSVPMTRSWAVGLSFWTWRQKSTHATFDVGSKTGLDAWGADGAASSSTTSMSSPSGEASGASDDSSSSSFSSSGSPGSVGSSSGASGSSGSDGGSPGAASVKARWGDDLRRLIWYTCLRPVEVVVTMVLLLGGGALALSSSSSSSSSELSTTGCSPSGSEMGRTWVLREVANVVLLPTRDGSLQSSEFVW